MKNVEQEVSTLITALYKEHSASLLAVLVRLFGPHNFDMAEDLLHEAFNKALIHWQETSVPKNPPAWIMQTAKNKALDLIRSHKAQKKFADDLTMQFNSEWTLSETLEEAFTPLKIKDDQLRMIFICCREEIKPENRIVFILKHLCGFSLNAICRALLLPEATVKKRLLRTRVKLQEYPFEIPKNNELTQAIETVHTVLYLLFNEGFHCSDGKQAIKLSFCDEAIALVKMLINESTIVNQETLGLFALMHFHIARVKAKVDVKGANIPIDLQDRSLWNSAYINMGKRFLLFASSVNNGLTQSMNKRFYYEALIAQEHCIADTFIETNWQAIVELYDELITITHSPIVKLNQAIAIGYAGKVYEAIDIVTLLQHDKALAHSHMPLAILAHLHAKLGEADVAFQFAQQAKNKGGTPQEHQIMMQQLERLINK